MRRPNVPNEGESWTFIRTTGRSSPAAFLTTTARPSSPTGGRSCVPSSAPSHARARGRRARPRRRVARRRAAPDESHDRLAPLPLHHPVVAARLVDEADEQPGLRRQHDAAADGRHGDVPGGGRRNWKKLTPDSTGSYLNGTWSDLAPMHWTRRYYASAVLRTAACSSAAASTERRRRDRTRRRSTTRSPTSGPRSRRRPAGAGSATRPAPCCPTDAFFIGHFDSTKTAIYDPATDTWTAGPAKPVSSSEESWVLLPDDTVITVRCNSSQRADKYVAAANTWVSGGTLPVNIIEVASSEIGAGVLLYDGRAFFAGATDHTALYTRPAIATDPGTWAAGPDFPNASGRTVGCKDTPSCLLTNGRVLIAAGPVDGVRTTRCRLHLFVEHEGPSEAPSSRTASLAVRADRRRVVPPPVPRLRGVGAADRQPRRRRPVGARSERPDSGRSVGAEGRARGGRRAEEGARRAQDAREARQGGVRRAARRSARGRGSSRRGSEEEEDDEEEKATKPQRVAARSRSGAHARVRNGRLRKREPASPYRHGCSTAFVMPMRGPRTISGSPSRARSSNGDSSSARPSCSRVIAERLAQPPRPGAEQPLVPDPAPRAHHVEPLRRLERADQHRIRDADVLADEVQAPVDPVRAVDVRVPGRAEHRRVALGPAAEAVRGGILVVVRLDLDDHAADAVDEQRGADQLGRDVVHRAREELTRERVTRACPASSRSEATPGRAETRRRCRYAEKSAGDDREAQARQRRDDARLDVAERRRARDLHELDAGEPAAHALRRRAQHDRGAEDRADVVGRARHGEQQQPRPQRVREAEGCDRDPPPCGCDHDREPLAAHVRDPSGRERRRRVHRRTARRTCSRRAPGRRTCASRWRGTAPSASRRPSR